MTATRSEQMFEHFCNRHRIRWRRIPAASTRTPDYEMLLARRKVIVEVKEISPNKDELAAQRIARQGGFAVVSSIPGDRVRAKISNAIPQLKAATKRRMSGLLVLLDTGFSAEHTSAYNIRTAMHGFETHYLGVPQDLGSETYLKDKDFGGGKKTTVSSNTSLSAIAVIEPWSVPPRLKVYHNPFARVPLPLAGFRKYGVTQLGLGAKVPGQVPDWVEL